ncbi:MAG: hypothetical protein M0D55_15970 [Elusimicrobiota bacterium]|nr:MAG: hypothetical protein M0D55_15970 [Elusimicrobiota bacterium]
MKHKWFDPRPLTRANACFWAFLFSVIITSVVAVKHAAYAEALAPGVSGIGEGILISYMLMWPGVAIFLMLLADGMCEEQRFSKRLFARSVLGGILPVLINYGFVLLVSKLSYPWNSYVAVSAIPTAVIVPMVVFALAITERWPFSFCLE